MIINSKFKYALPVIPVSDVMRYGLTLTIIYDFYFKIQTIYKNFKGKFRRNVYMPLVSCSSISSEIRSGVKEQCFFMSAKLLTVKSSLVVFE